MSAKPIFYNKIIESAYNTWKLNKKGWGSTFLKRLNQVSMWNESQRIDWEEKALFHLYKIINSELISMIGESERVVLFRMVRAAETDVVSDALNFSIKIYGSIYSKIDLLVKKIIENDHNYKKIIFRNKSELKEIVSEMTKKTGEELEKIVSSIYKSCTGK